MIIYVVTKMKFIIGAVLDHIGAFLGHIGAFSSWVGAVFPNIATIRHKTTHTHTSFPIDPNNHQTIAKENDLIKHYKFRAACISI